MSALVLAADPGDSTGFALVQEDGTLVERWISSGYADMLEDLDRVDRVYGSRISTVIYEDFRVFRQKNAAPVGSRLVTVQVIGGLRMWAHLHAVPSFEVEQNAHNMGARYTGERSPSDHKHGHHVDASNMAAWWLVKEGLVLAKDLAGAKVPL